MYASGFMTPKLETPNTALPRELLLKSCPTIGSIPTAELQKTSSRKTSNIPLKKEFLQPMTLKHFPHRLHPFPRVTLK